MATRTRRPSTHRSPNGASRTRKHRAAATPILDGMADGIMNRIKDIGSEAVHAADGHVRSIRNSANSYVKKSRKRAGQWERSLEHRVEERPIMALLAVSFIGFVLGMIFSRRNS